MAGMTKAERAELGALIRKREKVLKYAMAERSAELLAQFDAQSAKIYHWDDDATWKKIHDDAQAAVEKAKEALAARCTELGIPSEFAPQLGFGWAGRGHTAVAERRRELRQAAKSRIEAIEKAAITKIERLSLDAQTEVLAQGLESVAAKAFLEAMPAINTLMPQVQVEEIQSLIETQRADRRQRYLQ